LLCIVGNCSSTTFEFFFNFQGEKVADTKTRLHQLMVQTPQTSDKSLLVQTVALFEALLAKIHQLQDDNESMKKVIENHDELNQLTKDRDQVVLELESTRNLLSQANQVRSKNPDTKLGSVAGVM
jgi:hypothetical protein